jgi:putative DNA methylase
VTYKKKLIEVALPLAEVSDASARERLVKRGKPSSLHLWWARRPFVSARAVLWASLVDDPSANESRFPTLESQAAERERLFGILERLVQWENSNDAETLREARAEVIASCGGTVPTVVDPFGGGATIPLESMRLGLPTVSGDLNPVAVLLQRGMLSLPYQFAECAPVHPRLQSRVGVQPSRLSLAEDLLEYGQDLRSEVYDLLGSSYPNVETDSGRTATPIAWLWARTVPSPDPAWKSHVPLVGSWLLRTKSPRQWISPLVDVETQRISYTIASSGEPPAGTVKRSGATCIATGAPISFSYIREMAMAGKMGTQLIAVVAAGDRQRIYLPPSDEQADASLRSSPSWRPDSQLQGKARQNVSLYGVDRFDQLFTERQLATLAELSGRIDSFRARILQDAQESGLSDDPRRARDGGCGAAAYADAVATYLGFAVDRLADWNNSLCRWENKAQVPQQLFAGHSMPMVWDFAEANIFSSSTGSLNATLKTLATSLRSLPAGREPARVEQIDAGALARSMQGVVFSTDPPYYANINYADLADFFFVWLRRSVAEIWPSECATLLSPKDDEIIANQFSRTREDARDHFEQGMRRVLGEMRVAQSPDFPATIFYAYKQEEESSAGRTSTGWETFLQGLIDSGFTITATWPIRTENRSRLMAAGSNALASSIVLACRPRSSSSQVATRGELISALREEMEPAVRLLQAENIAPVDMAQSAIGPGIAIFSRFARVIESDGDSMVVRTALALVNETLSEVLSGEESEFDPDTRFAITWFEQYGHNQGPFGDADSLARAKNTSVVGVAQAGLVASREGKVRLIERSDLPDGWDPASDSRLTVWESTQHLIRALESSESDAAALLARMGDSYGERARQLAYLLYGICDRKKWADDAGAYNMLVTAWPEIARLAVSSPGPAEGDENSLF